MAVERAEAALEARDVDDPTLEAALAALDAAASVASGRDAARLDAYRAEVLRRLGRMLPAGDAYARALAADLEDGEALREGLLDLRDALGAHERVIEVAALARARHPGRAWQWDEIAAEAQRRIDLEREAPLDPATLGALRRRVGEALARTACPHDDRRPLTAAALEALGREVPTSLAWLSALGACCCDCQVAAVRGPREPRI
jgi:hypothetical protein